LKVGVFPVSAIDWVIDVAKKAQTSNTPAGKVVKTILRKICQTFCAQDTVRIVLVKLQRKENIAVSHYFCWSTVFFDAGKQVPRCVRPRRV
jgi:hypothetical protein